MSDVSDMSSRRIVKDYPYKGKTGPCTSRKDKLVAHISSYAQITTTRNETELLYAVFGVVWHVFFSSTLLTCSSRLRSPSASTQGRGKPTLAFACI